MEYSAPALSGQPDAASNAFGDLCGQLLHPQPAQARSSPAATIDVKEKQPAWQPPTAPLFLDTYEIAFTIIESAALATKTVGLDNEGRLIKTPSPPLYRGAARRITLRGSASDIAGQLRDKLKGIGPKEAVICARPPKDECAIVAERDLANNPDAITRSKKCFAPVDGPALLVLDFDMAEFPPALAQKIESLGGLHNALAAVHAPFGSAVSVSRGSASSGICIDGADGKRTGVHCYFIVNDGTKIESFVRILADRLMLAGFVWGKITKTGDVLPRTIFDVAASCDTSRLVYEADAVLKSGRLSYSAGARDPEVRSGGILEIGRAAPLNDTEKDALVKTLAALKRDLAAPAAAQRRQYEEDRIAEAVAKGANPDTARQNVKAAIDQKDLSLDDEIVLAGDDLTGGVCSVTVREILEAPDAYHEKRCADPLEPDYGGGRTDVAIIYTDRGAPNIFSHAHGGVRYSLNRAAAGLVVERWFDKAPEHGLVERDGAKGALETVSIAEAAETALESSAKPLIKGLLDQGTLSVVYGESNVGKTFVAMDIARAVAMGMLWGGRRSAKTGVLYIAAEGGAGARKRCSAMVRRYPDLAATHFQLLMKSVNLLRPDADLKPIIETVKQMAQPVGLIVVDTLSRVMAGGDENASTDMGALVRHFDALRQATGAHVMVVHHSGKDASRGARGHSLLRAATDTEIEIGNGRIDVTKQRDIDGSFSREFKLIPVELGKDADGDSITSCTINLSAAAAPSARLPEKRRSVLEAARAYQKQHASQDGLRPADIACALRMTPEQVRGHLKNLHEAGHVTKAEDRKDHWYAPPPVVAAHFEPLEAGENATDIQCARKIAIDPDG